MRVDEDQEWLPRYLFQPLQNFITACIFEYGIAMYDLDLGEHLREKKGVTPELKSRIKLALNKITKQVTKDYVVHPVLAGPSGYRRTLAANAIANLVRNLWSHSIIMCGHFPEGVETFELESLDPNESRGEWYLRQMLGSADISGSKLMHLMSGNLSHQIEHHLFPDLPSNRYAEIAPEIEDLFQRYGLSYNSRPLVQQVASAWHKVIRLSLPNGWLASTNMSNAPQQLKLLVRMARGKESPLAALPAGS
jgi:NADPH-dependent stearoyl-CoA 9-desaturase